MWGIFHRVLLIQHNNVIDLNYVIWGVWLRYTRIYETPMVSVYHQLIEIHSTVLMLIHSPITMLNTESNDLALSFCIWLGIYIRNLQHRVVHIFVVHINLRVSWNWGAPNNMATCCWTWLAFNDSPHSKSLVYEVYILLLPPMLVYY